MTITSKPREWTIRLVTLIANNLNGSQIEEYADDAIRVREVLPEIEPMGIKDNPELRKILEPESQSRREQIETDQFLYFTTSADIKDSMFIANELNLACGVLKKQLAAHRDALKVATEALRQCDKEVLLGNYGTRIIREALAKIESMKGLE
ncbi:MAG TPA: hypothetical protein VJ044_11735 [Candidatus Hodarchaeales archaeon]|nr:hypothetical protein [Candidatus Hodarchaeales archaeon]